MRSNAVASELPSGKTTTPRFARDCQPQAIGSNPSIQAGDSTLALIDETFVMLDWKGDYIAAVIGIDPPRLSRAMNEKDGKTFDARWLSKLPSEFWVAFLQVVARKFNITRESRQELLLDAICGHLDSLKTLVKSTAVSE
jgi:hypothetical protein